MMNKQELSNITGALFDFAGFLVHHNVCKESEISKDIVDFLRTHKIDLTNIPVNFKEWDQHFKNKVETNTRDSVEFYRYVRPIDPRTGLIDSKQGVCFNVKLDYASREMIVGTSVCNNDTFDKEHARELSNARAQSNCCQTSGRRQTFDIDAFTNLNMSIVDFMKITFEKFPSNIGRAALAQMRSK